MKTQKKIPPGPSIIYMTFRKKFNSLCINCYFFEMSFKTDHLKIMIPNALLNKCTQVLWFWKPKLIQKCKDIGNDRFD